MKYFFVLMLSLAAFSCVHKGAESKYVKFQTLDLTDDGNDGDSAFFRIVFANKSDFPLTDPYIRMVIKDTTDKMFKPILFSASKTFETVPPHTEFLVYFYGENFQYSDAVGKTKIYLSWTNSKGKKSLRRKVEY